MLKTKFRISIPLTFAPFPMFKKRAILSDVLSYSIPSIIAHLELEELPEYVPENEFAPAGKFSPIEEKFPVSSKFVSTPRKLMSTDWT